MMNFSVQKKFYFQTDKKFRKYKPILSNPNIALCIDNIQLESVCKDIGRTFDNVKFVEVFEKNYESYYKNYSNLSDEVLFEISPRYIQRWLYIDRKPFVEKMYFESKTYSIDEYDLRVNPI